MLRTWTIALLAGFSLGSAADAAVLFVKPTPTGAGDCGSWADACALTDAINSAVSGDEVWVQAGVYGPIRLKDGVKIVGGFAGTETAVSQSNPATNVTIVDGGGVIRVVSSYNNPASTVLRGFHVRNGAAGDEIGGGGMLLISSSATIVQCIFENNQASLFGAAVSIRTSPSPGGAIPRPQFVNCEFRHNGNGESLYDVQPFAGGAIFAFDGSPSFVNCLFHHNRGGEGGAVWIGAIRVFAYSPFINCTFAHNTAFANGGAIWDIEGYASLYNCILWGNVRVGGPGYDDQIHNLYGNLVRNCDIQGGWYGSNNIDADPLFENSAADDYILKIGSPCIGTANNIYLPTDVADLDWDGDTFETIPVDLGLLPRILGIAVDIGAYETPFCGDGNCEADENSCNCPQDCGPAAPTEQVGSTCHDGIDNDCDAATDCADSDCGPDPACMGIIPTVSEWGLVILTLLLLTGAKIYFGHQPARRTILHTRVD